jgi:hypothetical protein
MIVAVCPGNFATGGPEAIHQFVDMANQVQPSSAKICYFPFDGEFVKRPEYAMYDSPAIVRGSIPDDAVILVPEVCPELVFEFHQPCVLWWLSVDNFSLYQEDLLELFYLHVAQSHYARETLLARYGLQALMLSDYINMMFTEQQDSCKEPIIAVNPAKGRELIDKFIRLNPSLRVTPLERMSRLEVRKVLEQSRAFIDFGHHPGKDRLPREAALQDVVVLVRHAGAATNKRDVALPHHYVFDQQDIPALGNLIKDILNDPTTHIEAQEEYRRRLSSEQDVFRDEVIEFLRVSSSIERDRERSERLDKRRRRDQYILARSNEALEAAHSARDGAFVERNVAIVARNEALAERESLRREVQRLRKVEVELIRKVEVELSSERAAVAELTTRLEAEMTRAFLAESKVLELRQVRAEIEEIRASTSWRLGSVITAPVRKIRSLLKR